MDDDLQPRIAILGAGPIGLEAAIYGRYLGYPVEVLERAAQPASQVLNGDESFSLSFALRASTLVIAALRSQDPQWQCPAATEVLSPAEWHRRYLLPLAESDLVAEALRLSTEVVQIDRDDNDIFQIRCRDSQGAPVTHEADIVIDATGIEGNRDWYPAEHDDGELGFANPESDYYILGSKSCPGGAFSVSDGLVQIRDLFAILGERDDLDVYATMPPIA